MQKVKKETSLYIMYSKITLSLQQTLYPDIEKKVYRAARIYGKVAEKDKQNYGGCLYKVGFKVDQEVSLVGLEFLGPAEKDGADYRVRVGICRTDEVWSWCSAMLGCLGSGPSFNTVDLMPIYTLDVQGCKKGESFYVPLPKPVEISPNIWTDIKFELKGPETERLDWAFWNKNVPTDPSCVNFDFMMDSRQLSAVHFIRNRNRKQKEACMEYAD